jgi:hypothetical protein
MKTVPQSVFNEPRASELERKRDKARRHRRIIYDCYNATVESDQGISCRKGMSFAQPFHLREVLNARTPAVCRKCADYDDGGNPEG